MKMGNLQVGLIGIGVMGKHHARILNSLEGVDLIGIVDPGQSAYIKNLYPQLEIFAKPKELSDKKLDYCVIAAPTGFHKQIAIDMLKAGVHCLIEKPVALNYTDAQLIKEHTLNGSLIVGVGHIERYNAAIRELRKRILNGELGEIYELSFRRQGPFPSRIDDVGVVKDLATHDIDLAIWLTGHNFTKVSGHVVNKSGRIHEDLVSINGLLSNNVIVNISVNWLSPYKERKLLVTCEKGAYTVDLLSAELKFYENGSHKVSQETYLHFNGVTQGNITNYAFDKPEPLLMEHLNFQKAILGQDAEIVSLIDGIEVLRVADAVIKSSLEGLTVQL
jgi:UDP-N-acetylglucosamine 3-dehydrogenase